MRLVIIITTALIMCGCQSTQRAILGAYFSGIECFGDRCPVCDCEYCNPNLQYVSTTNTSAAEGPQLHPICKPECKYCEKIRRFYLQGEFEANCTEDDESKTEKLANFENEMELSKDIENFLSDTMPQVKESRRKIKNLYFKTKKFADNMLKSANNTKSSDAKLLCLKKRKELMDKCIVISQKYSDINAKIENVYVKYNISKLEENSSSSNEINQLSNQLVSDIEFVENEVSK